MTSILDSITVFYINKSIFVIKSEGLFLIPVNNEAWRFSRVDMMNHECLKKATSSERSKEIFNI